MLASLALAGLALRAGLRLRRARRRGARRLPGDLRRHLRLAKTALAALVLGAVGGPLSVVWLRGWDAFGSAHAWVAGTTLTLFAATGLLGRRLERGDRRLVELHALLASLSVLAAAAAFGTGFVLLP